MSVGALDGFCYPSRVIGEFFTLLYYARKFNTYFSILPIFHQIFLGYFLTNPICTRFCKVRIYKNRVSFFLFVVLHITNARLSNVKCIFAPTKQNNYIMKENTSPRFVAYYRVSTREQNLGIPAQREIVRQYVAQVGGVIVDEVEEKMSGKIDARPGLTAALTMAKQSGAALIVAKLDRLTRRLAFGAALCEKYDIVFCDHPEMDALQQGIFFGMAQKERELISQRTRAALAAKRAQGVKLGAPNARFTDEMRSASAATRKEIAKADKANRAAFALVGMARKLSPSLSWSYLANYLNENGMTTPRGGRWSCVQVQRLCALYA